MEVYNQLNGSYSKQLAADVQSMHAIPILHFSMPIPIHILSLILPLVPAPIMVCPQLRTALPHQILPERSSRNDVILLIQSPLLQLRHKQLNHILETTWVCNISNVEPITISHIDPFLNTSATS